MGKICGRGCSIYFCGEAIAEQHNAPGVECTETQHIRPVRFGRLQLADITIQLLEADYTFPILLLDSYCLKQS